MDNFEISPYDILDINPNASTAEIKSRYRQLVLMYHPDKCNTQYVNSGYFDQIQKAYKVVIGIRRDSQMPSDNLDYNIEDTLQNELDKELNSILDFNKLKFDPKINYESSEFNTKFEEFNDKFKELRNDFYKGHREFDTRTTTTEYNPSVSSNFITPKIINKDTLGQYTGEVKYAKDKPLNYGLVSCESFSTKTDGKNGISGGDLSDVFTNTITEDNSFINYENIDEVYNKKVEERNNEIYVLLHEKEAKKKLDDKHAEESKDYIKKTRKYRNYIQSCFGIENSV